MLNRKLRLLALSKQQFVAGMEKAHVSLEDKIKGLRFLNPNPKESCTEVATEFQCWKMARGYINKIKVAT